MSEILISKSGHVEWVKNDKGKRVGFKLAFTFSGTDLIVLHKVPIQERPFVEDKMVDVFVHESLHITLRAINLDNASITLDNLVPYDHSLTALIWKLEKRRKPLCRK